MASFTGLTDLITTLSTTGNSEFKIFTKMNYWVSSAATAQTMTAIYPNSLWCYDGIPGASGYPPPTAEICTRNTGGAIKQTNPSVGKEKYLLNFIGAGNIPGIMMLYDRLCHVAGLSGNTLTVQTINTPNLTRYSGSSAVGNIIFIEFYNTINITPNILVTYTNQNGVSRTTFVNIRSSARGTSHFIPLVSGDTGVRSVQSVQITSGGGIQGNFGVTIARPLAVSGNGVINTPTYRDLITGLPGIPKILDDACLSILYTPPLITTASGTQTQWYLHAGLTFVEK